jgi:glutathione S-transferase
MATAKATPSTGATLACCLPDRFAYKEAIRSCSAHPSATVSFTFPNAPAGMLTLFHHPFCPHSRFVRLILEELGLTVRLVEERVWERRDEFLMLNPAGTTPVLVEEGVPPIPGATIIAEYLDETRAAAAPQVRLLPSEAGDRVEVRRLMSWFNDKLFAEASGPLVTERVYKRFMPAERGGGAPDTETMRAARSNMRYHLGYIGWLIRRRDWLAGERLSYADLSAAAHLSAVDYLGDVPWDADETAKAWYARIKSRPSFRALLGDTLPGLTPSPSYANLDF